MADADYGDFHGSRIRLGLVSTRTTPEPACNRHLRALYYRATNTIRMAISEYLMVMAMLRESGGCISKVGT